MKNFFANLIVAFILDGASTSLVAQTQNPIDASRLDSLVVSLKAGLDLTHANCSFSLTDRRDRVRNLNAYLGEFRSRRLGSTATETGFWWSTNSKCMEWAVTLKSKNFLPSEFALALGKLSLDERNQFYLGYFDRGILDIVAGTQIVVSPTFFVPLAPKYDENDLQALMEDIRVPGNRVTWATKGEHRFEFQSPEFHRSISTLAWMLWDEKYAESLKGISRAEDWMDTNLEDTASRTEPIDLVSRSWTERIEKIVYSTQAVQQPTEKLTDVQLVNISKSAVLEALNFREISGRTTTSFYGFAPAVGNELLIACPSRSSKLEFVPSSTSSIDPSLLRITRFFDSSPLQIYLVRIDDELWKGRDRIQVSGQCGNFSFQGDLKKRDLRNHTPLPVNTELRFSNKSERRILATLGLTSEMDMVIASALKAHLVSKGWRLIKEEPLTLDRENLIERLQSSDAVIPIAHAIEQSRLQFGFRESVDLLLERTSSHGIHNQLEIILPKMAGTGSRDVNREIFLDRSDMVSIFRNRMTADRSRLNVFNMTCRGSQVIPGWMEAFHQFNREAADNSKSVSQLPLLIGSTEGFRAEKMDEYEILASYFDAFIDGLNDLQNEPELIQMLNKPSKASLSGRQLENGFDAVSNFRAPYNSYLIDGRRFEIQLNDTMSGAEILKF